MDPPNRNRPQRLSQVLAACSINRCSQTRLEHDPPMDGIVPDFYHSRFHEKTKELPRSSATPHPDCGGKNEGNSERRWLEQVGQVATRLAIPLWQSWDRGQKLPPVPLIASVEPVFGTDYRNRVTVTQTELSSTCTPSGMNTEGFTLDQDGVAKGSSTNLKMHGLDHTSQVEESGTDTDVLDRQFNMATDHLGWISAGLESFGCVAESPGNKRGRLHTCHTQGTLLRRC